MAHSIAWTEAQRYAAETLGNCPIEVLEELFPSVQIHGAWAVDIAQSGEPVHSMGSAGDVKDPYERVYTIAPNYPVITYQYTIDENGPHPTEAYIPAETASTYKNPSDNPLARTEGQTPVYTDEHYDRRWDEYGNMHQVVYTLNYYQGPEYEVTVKLASSSVLGTEFALMSLLYPFRDLFIPSLLVSLLTLAVTLVYLCVAAGRTKSGEIIPTGLNRLPLDLYACISAGGIAGLVLLMIVLLESYYYGYYGIWDNLPLCMLILGLGSFFIALLAIGFLFAFAAQVKVKGGYWWRHSVCGFLMGKALDALRWVRRGLRYFYRGCRAVVRMLPVIWQWLLTAFLMVVLPAFFFLLTISCHGIIELFWGMLCLLSLIADVAIVCYGGWCFGILLKGAKTMSQGNLNHQPP
jgi:hypothetical protein